MADCHSREILLGRLFGSAILILPYVTAQQVPIFGFHIHLFTWLVTAGMLTGFAVATYRGRRYGFTRERIALFSLFLIGGGVLGARLGRLLYEPELLRQAFSQPAVLILAFHGISSFGACFGGLAGALLFFRLHCSSTRERLQLLDAAGFALPFAWCLGRIGCALVHDHPGIQANSWLSVAFPDGPRYDLGLIEALFLALLSFIFLALDRRRARPAGFYFACYFSVYGPFRFLLDQLHVDPPRYFGWSVDQYGALFATTVAAVTWLLISRPLSLRSEHPHDIPYRPVSEA